MVILLPLWLLCRPLCLLNVPIGSAHSVPFCGVIVVIVRWLPAGCAGVRVGNIVAVGEAVVVVCIAFHDIRLLLSCWWGIELILVISSEISPACGVTST
jgi:hypothetical protein